MWPPPRQCSPKKFPTWLFIVCKQCETGSVIHRWLNLKSFLINELELGTCCWRTPKPNIARKYFAKMTLIPLKGLGKVGLELSTWSPKLIFRPMIPSCTRSSAPARKTSSRNQCYGVTWNKKLASWKISNTPTSWNCTKHLKVSYVLILAEGWIFMLMEYCNMGNLGSILSKRPNKVLPLPEAKKIICEVIDGLEYMHERKIVHRDIKP